MDLFDYMRTNTMKQESPLASRMRPETLDQVVGQKHIVGPGTLLYRAIKADQLGSIIFYGPQDHSGESDCPYYQSGILSDQRHRSRQKGYGRGGSESQGYFGDVWETDDPFCR